MATQLFKFPIDKFAAAMQPHRIFKMENNSNVRKGVRRA